MWGVFVLTIIQLPRKKPCATILSINYPKWAYSTVVVRGIRTVPARVPGI